jgi:hypothetical protein
MKTMFTSTKSLMMNLMSGFFFKYYFFINKWIVDSVKEKNYAQVIAKPSML